MAMLLNIKTFSFREEQEISV